MLKAAPPFPAAVALAWKAGVSSRVSCKLVDLFWTLFIEYFLAGSLLLMALEWRRPKQLRLDSFFRNWVSPREARIKTPKLAADGNGLPSSSRPGPESAGSYDRRERPPTQPPVLDFKFSCPNCGQHIQCDYGYSGRQINCPVCCKTILVSQLSHS